MTSVHLLPDLTWETCEATASCRVAHHVPDADLDFVRHLHRQHIIDLFALDGPPDFEAEFHKEWHDAGKKHRDYDLPALIYRDGTKHWYQHGKIHRDKNDEPAVIYAASGNREWWQHDTYYRADDKPAVITGDGSQTWYENGMVHRENDLPAQVDADGSCSWYRYNKLWRADNKPTTVNRYGDQIWHDEDSNIHAELGVPAIIRADGTHEYWTHGDFVAGIGPEDEQ